MEASSSDVHRLRAGDSGVDDPGLSDIAGFLADLRQAYPPVRVDHVRDAHLAAVALEVRRQAVAPAAPVRAVAHRTVAVVSVAVLSVFGAGVGVAAAMGADPLSLLPGLRIGPPAAPRSAAPAPDTPTPTPAPSVAPTRPALPRPASPAAHRTPSPGSEGKGNSSEKSNNGKADENRANRGNSDAARAEHQPTARPSQANNRKADPPAKSRLTAKPSPPAKPGKTGA